MTLFLLKYPGGYTKFFSFPWDQVVPRLNSQIYLLNISSILRILLDEILLFLPFVWIIKHF
jgi:hypothetical protein